MTDAELVALLRIGDDPLCRYAADRIEALQPPASDRSEIDRLSHLAAKQKLEIERLRAELADALIQVARVRYRTRWWQKLRLLTR